MNRMDDGINASSAVENFLSSLNAAVARLYPEAGGMFSLSVSEVETAAGISGSGRF